MTTRTTHTEPEIRDMLDRGRHREAAGACRNVGNDALMGWAMLLLGKLTEAMAFATKANKAGSETARACVIQLCSNEVGRPNVNAMRWMEESLIFWDKMLSADPKNKDILARRDYARERRTWISTHLETDKYEPAYRAGNGLIDVMS